MKGVDSVVLGVVGGELTGVCVLDGAREEFLENDRVTLLVVLGDVGADSNSSCWRSPSRNGLSDSGRFFLGEANENLFADIPKGNCLACGAGPCGLLGSGDPGAVCSRSTSILTSRTDPTRVGIEAVRSICCVCVCCV